MSALFAIFLSLFAGYLLGALTIILLAAAHPDPPARQSADLYGVDGDDDDPWRRDEENEEDEEDDSDICPLCHNEREWVDCWDCGGDGIIDGERLMEEDPSWYSIDDEEPCSQCNGRGGWYECWVCQERAKATPEVIDGEK